MNKSGAFNGNEFNENGEIKMSNRKFGTGKLFENYYLGPQKLSLVGGDW